jgi:hypothetical protein
MSFVLPLLVVGIIIAIVVLVRRQHRGERETVGEPGLGTVRRLYYYVIAFVALMLAGNGAALLISYGIDSAASALTRSQTQLPLGLALTLVGTPMWLLFRALAQRSVQQFPTEVRSLTRKVYIYLVLIVSLALAVLGLQVLLRWAMGGIGLEGNAISWPVVWGALFAFHWGLESREGVHTELTRSLRRLYVYLVAFAGLLMLSSSGGVLLERVFRLAYHAIFEATGRLLPYGPFWDDPVKEWVSSVIVGGLIWAWYWFYVVRGDLKSVLRHVYLYFAVVGGTITTGASLSVLLYGVLRWIIGGTTMPAAVLHFEFFPAALSPLFIGVALWGYHWAVLRSETQVFPDMLRAARRSYRYMMAAIGLVTLAAGLVFLFSLFIDLVAPQAREPLVEGDWWRRSLAVAVTTLLVGTPLWGIYWSGAQREAMARGAEEREALSRRVFLYAVFGAAVLAAVGSLSFVLYSVFQPLLGESTGASALGDLKWGLGILLTTGAVGMYYWLVLREDHRTAIAIPRVAEAPQPARVHKQVIALAPAEARQWVSTLEARLGYRIDVWTRLGATEGVFTPTDEDLAATEERIEQAPGDRVLLTIEPSGVHVIPFEDG